MRAILCGIALAVAACSSHPAGVKPQFAGGSRTDGIVTMASTATIYNPVAPDWRVAAAAADRRCHGWGHDGPAEFAGDQHACLVYDLYGRCTATTVTRFYSCSG